MSEAPLIDPEGWDWAAQRARLERAFADIEAEEKIRLAPGDPVRLAFLFVPHVPGAMPVALMERLGEAGYPARIREADATHPKAIAARADLAFEAEAIWEADRATTRLALANGFVPFGWTLSG